MSHHKWAPGGLLVGGRGSKIGQKKCNVLFVGALIWIITKEAARCNTLMNLVELKNVIRTNFPTSLVVED